MNVCKEDEEVFHFGLRRRIIIFELKLIISGDREALTTLYVSYFQIIIFQASESSQRNRKRVSLISKQHQKYLCARVK
jgi:hypothetical protein